MLTRQRKNVLWKEELNLLQDIKVFDKEPKYCQTKIANADPCHNFDFSLFSFFNWLLSLNLCLVFTLSTCRASAEGEEPIQMIDQRIRRYP